ncbi:hypothetical protein OKZ62_001762 [Vibrio navarrensis]|nr:hypothetical protein [Vibrio navarrensis]
MIKTISLLLSSIIFLAGCDEINKIENVKENNPDVVLYNGDCIELHKTVYASFSAHISRTVALLFHPLTALPLRCSEYKILLDEDALPFELTSLGKHSSSLVGGNNPKTKTE